MKSDSQNPSNVSTLLLEVRDLCAGYGKRQVLNGVNVQVHRNEAVVLFGDNGVGKTTLLRVIAGQQPCLSGEIFLDTIRLSGLLPQNIQRKGLGYLMQGGRVFPSLSVLENIAVARQSACDRNRCGGETHDDTFMSVLKNKMTRNASLLSGAERQLLSLEMAFLQRPRMLLMDEPTAGLESAVAEAVMRRIQRFAAQPGHSVLFIEHNVELAVRTANRVLTLNNGVVCGASQLNRSAAN